VPLFNPIEFLTEKIKMRRMCKETYPETLRQAGGGGEVRLYYWRTDLLIECGKEIAALYEEPFYLYLR
jgi:hypothetical protein